MSNQKGGTSRFTYKKKVAVNNNVVSSSRRRTRRRRGGNNTVLVPVRPRRSARGNNRRTRRKRRSTNLARPIAPPLGKVTALRSAMARYFPNNYPGGMPFSNMAAPGHTSTLRWSTTVSSISDGVAYTCVVALNGRPKSALKVASAFAANVVSAETTSDVPGYATLSGAASAGIPVGFEITLTSMASVQSLQGIWCSIVAQTNTTVGQSIGSLQTWGNKLHGTVTDSHPSARAIWAPFDENDGDMVPSTTAATSSETAIIIAIQTTAATNFVLDACVQYRFAPSLSGQQFIPGEAVTMDVGAYNDALNVVGPMLNKNPAIITDPVVADKEHPGMLRNMAEAIASTVGEAKALAEAASEAKEFVTGLFTIGGVNIFDLDHDPDVDHILRSVLSLSCSGADRLLTAYEAKRLKFELPPEVVECVRKLKKYELKYNRRNRSYSVIDNTLPSDEEGVLLRTYPPGVLSTPVERKSSIPLKK